MPDADPFPDLLVRASVNRALLLDLLCSVRVANPVLHADVLTTRVLAPRDRRPVSNANSPTLCMIGAPLVPAFVLRSVPHANSLLPRLAPASRHAANSDLGRIVLCLLLCRRFGILDIIINQRIFLLRQSGTRHSNLALPCLTRSCLTSLPMLTAFGLGMIV